MPPPKYHARRMPVVIPFQQTVITLEGGAELTCRVGAAKTPPDVRSTQVFELWRGKHEVTRMTYKEIVAMTSDPEAMDGLDPAVGAVFMGFRSSVDSVIPYDIQNLAHDITIQGIMQLLRETAGATIQGKLCHRVSWHPDELAILKLKYPQLDLESTIMRHAYVRSLRRVGLWGALGTPDILAEYGAERRWPKGSDYGLDGSATEGDDE